MALFFLPFPFALGCTRNLNLDLSRLLGQALRPVPPVFCSHWENLRHVASQQEAAR